MKAYESKGFHNRLNLTVMMLDKSLSRNWGAFAFDIVVLKLWYLSFRTGYIAPGVNMMTLTRSHGNTKGMDLPCF